MNDAFGLIHRIKIDIEKIQAYKRSSLSREILKLIYKHVDSFEEIAKTTLQTDLQRAISSEVTELQVIVDQIGKRVRFSKEDVENLKQRFDSFTSRLKMEEQRCADGLYNTFPDNEEDEEEENPPDAVSSKVIGACDVYEQLKDTLMGKSKNITSLVGMPGIGKTTLAKKLFHDPAIVQHFDRRVWIRVGKKYRVRDLPRRILVEIDPNALPGEDDVQAIHEYLVESLKSKCYLIVLDDVWDKYITTLWYNFRYKYKKPNHPMLDWTSDGSRILCTSRLQQLSIYRGRLGPSFGVVQMRLLNKEESWDLLRDRVFLCKGLSCPPQLEKAGKKISKKCEGLPLIILTVARLLSAEENSTPEYWNEVAKKRNHRIFMEAYDEISKVLLPSYTYLPPLLRMCFLYIGLFPQVYEVPRSRLINLWLSDRFPESNININSYVEAIDCLEELVSNSVVMVYKNSVHNRNHTIKTCGLHSSLWHLAKKKSGETKFALILSSPDDCLGDGMVGHQRLSFLSNSLLGMKEVHKSVEDNCASTVRSLLCFGPYHPYQVPLCFHLKLLRELDAISIRFYEFPLEVLQLVWLTYLSLTSNGNIPTSISQLQFLEFFIVDQHQSIKFSKDASYLPVEIWSLSKLKHLQVIGRDLPDPRGASLDSLLTLSKVSTRSCTEAVFAGVPNLRELYIQIELAPDDDDGEGKLLSCLDHISDRREFISLKYVIVNPAVVTSVVPNLCIPRYLEHLCLSGLGYPWEKMRMIVILPYLKVLKLKNYAFQGPVWKVGHEGFHVLESLVIEDTDVEHWYIGDGACDRVYNLVIKNCYKLKRIHGWFGRFLLKVECVDCHPSLMEDLKSLTDVDIVSHSSWIERKLKT